jgi:hypothetical protein
MSIRGSVLLVLALAVLVVPNAFAASWHVGAEHPNSYGVWAYIRTPVVAPFTVDYGQSGQSNWVSTPGTPNWLQAGWHFYYDWGAAERYVEFCINNCTFQDFVPVSPLTQAWGTTVEYMVQHIPGTTDLWCAYVAGVQEDCEHIAAPPLTVQVFGNPRILAK